MEKFAISRRPFRPIALVDLYIWRRRWMLWEPGRMGRAV